MAEVKIERIDGWWEWFEFFVPMELATEQQADAFVEKLKNLSGVEYNNSEMDEDGYHYYLFMYWHKDHEVERMKQQVIDLWNDFIKED